MSDSRQKMKGRVFAAPLAIGLAVFCVLGLAMAPMFHAAPHDVAMAIVNEDEGATLPTGESVNAGVLAVDAVTAAADDASQGDASPIAWTELESEEALDEAMENGDFYGAVVIPADFTQMQMAGTAAVVETLQENLPSLLAASQAAAGGMPPAAPGASQAVPEAALQAQAASEVASQAAPAASEGAPQAQMAQVQAVQSLAAGIVQAQQSADKPSVEVIVNVAKSPMVAQQMQSSVTAMMAQAGLQANITTIGQADTGDSPLAAMMGVQFMVMPLFVMSIVMGAVFVVVRWPRRGASRAEKAREVGRQIVYCALASLVAAVFAYGMVAWIGGASVDAQAVLLLWLASFCLMAAVVGLSDIAMPLGVLVMVCVFALGMATAVLPAEMLPAFWADMVLPWAPQFCIGEGLRGIIYLGKGAFDAGVLPLLAWAIVGAAAFAAAIAMPSRSREQAAASADAKAKA